MQIIHSLLTSHEDEQMTEITRGRTSIFCRPGIAHLEEGNKLSAKEYTALNVVQHLTAHFYTILIFQFKI